MPVWVKEADELPVIGNNLTKKVLAQKSFVVDPDPTVFLNANVNLGGEMNSDPDPAKKCTKKRKLFCKCLAVL